MWLFTTKGFISAVAWKDCDKTLCVRARRADHLAALFPDHEIMAWAGADYPYRCRVPREQFEQAMLAEMRAVDYVDFKSQLQDHAYHDACLDVWHAMHQLQQRD